MDTFFIILFVVCYLALCFYLSRRYHGSNYLKILSAIALLLLVWVGGVDAFLGPKLILSAIAFTAFWKGYLSLTKKKRVTL
jgi:hypothetical protein